MNVFGIGLPEMALILVVALLVFGPKKLPEIGRSLAQALGSFKKAQQEFETEFKRESAELEKSLKTPMKAEIEPPAPKSLPHEEADSQESTADTAVAEVPEPAAEADKTPVEATPEETVSDTPSAST